MTSIERLQAIFQDVLDDPSIRLTPDFSSAQHADWDSVVTLRLVLSVESEFGIRFTTAQVAGIKSVKDLLAVVDGR